MATEREVILRLKADTEGLEQGLDNVSNELVTINKQLTTIEDDLRNLSKEIGKGEAAKAFNKLNAIVEKNVLSIQDLGVAADNYKNIALAAGVTTPIGQEALRMAAEMESQMDRLNQTVAQLAEGGRALNTAMSLGTGIIAGYTAFQGVTALLGKENEELQETFVKLQAAQSILMGTKELSIALSKKGILVQTAEAAATKVLAITTAGYNAVVGSSTGLMKAFRIALISTGIGAIIVGLGLLIANFESINKWVKDSIAKLMNLKTTFLLLLGPIGWIILAYRELFGEEEKNAQAQRNYRKENAVAHGERLKQIEEEKNKRIDAIDRHIKAQQLVKETLEAQGKSSYKVTLDILEHEKMKLQAVLDANNLKIQSWVDYYKREMELSGMSEEQYRESMKSRGVDFEKLQAQVNEQMQTTQDAIQRAENEITAHKRGEYEKQKGLAEKNAADQAKIIADQLALQLSLEQQLIDLRLANMEEGSQKEFAILVEKQRREKEQLISKFGEDSELLKELEQKQYDELQGLLDKQEVERLKKEDEFNKKLIELRLGNLSEGKDKELALLKQKHLDELSELREKYGVSTELEKELLLKQKQELADVEAEFDNQAREKKLAEAQAVLDTVQGYMDTASEIISLMNELGEQEKERIAERRDKDLSELEKAKKKQLKVEGLTAKEKAQIEYNFAMMEYNVKVKANAESDKIAKKQFQRDKAMKLAQIGMDTAASVVKAIGMFGPPPSPLGIAGIASAGIIGGLQAAIVARSQFSGSSGSISPPDFSDFAVADNGGNSGGGSDGNGQNSQQNNVTTDIDKLINGGKSKVILSMVELNEMQNEMNQIEAVSAIGG